MFRSRRKLSYLTTMINNPSPVIILILWLSKSSPSAPRRSFARRSIHSATSTNVVAESNVDDNDEAAAKCHPLKGRLITGGRSDMSFSVGITVHVFCESFRRTKRQSLQWESFRLIPAATNAHQYKSRPSLQRELHCVLDQRISACARLLASLTILWSLITILRYLSSSAYSDELI